jgi:hypothetical protein
MLCPTMPPLLLPLLPQVRHDPLLLPLPPLLLPPLPLPPLELLPPPPGVDCPELAHAAIVAPANPAAMSARCARP